MSNIYTFPTRLNPSTPNNWQEKWAAAACYWGLAIMSQKLGGFPLTFFMLYALGYWVVIQPRRFKFSVFLRTHVLQALFAFMVLYGAVKGLNLILNLLQDVFALLPLGFVMQALLWVQAVLLGQAVGWAGLTLAVVATYFCLKGQLVKLPVVFPWASRLA